MVNLQQQEEAMKTILQTTKRTETDIEYEIATALFTVVAASSVLIGLWAVVCLASGIFSHGLVATLRGYLTAVTGF
jgi:hypothetical protein